MEALSIDLPRRRVLKSLAKTSVAACVVAQSAPAGAVGLYNPGSTRKLSLFNAHTLENIDAVFWQDGYYQDEALARLNHFLRDFRTGDEIEIDRALFDLVWDIQFRTGTNKRICVYSGYRTQQTNDKLRERSNGVAKFSYHIVGQAVDICIPEFDTERLRDIAIAMNAGGVGYYPGPNFVHVDTGPVRSWR